MEQLAEGEIGDQPFLQEIFLERLLGHVRTILAAAHVNTITEKAYLADKIMEAAPTAPVNKIVVKESDLKSEMDAVRKQINELQRQIRQMNQRMANLRSTTTQRSTNRKQHSREPSSSICYFHKRFGSRARKCMSPYGATHKRFLIDTGAEVSLLPRSFTDRRTTPATTILTAANDSVIATFGQRSLTLDLALRRTFKWILIIADVQTPILGADFLRKFNLLVDMKERRLIDKSTSFSTAVAPSSHKQDCRTQVNNVENRNHSLYNQSLHLYINRSQNIQH
ncbi:Uncharacterised protein r2_g4097 [Pycnogonum litorale]